jgi:hypothetical protein
MHNFFRTQCGIAAILLMAMPIAAAWPQDLSEPATHNLVIPPVTPDEADAYLSNRQLAPAESIPLPEVTGEAPVKLEINPVLGHDLPEGDTTPYGFKRADFAIAGEAAQNGRKRRDEALANGVITDNRPPVATIEESPPVIGGP